MSDTLEQLSDSPDSWGPQDERWKEYYASRKYVEISVLPTRSNNAPLPEAFGRNLDTLEKARLWLTNPHNWHSSKLFILKWDGLNVTISEMHGLRLIREPWDMGLPWSVVMTQKKRKAKKDRGESMEDELSPSGEEQTDG